MNKIPQEISKELAAKIIETREPRGLFFSMENGTLIGIDNRTGDAWTEEFTELDDLLFWFELSQEDREIFKENLKNTFRARMEEVARIWKEEILPALMEPIKKVYEAFRLFIKNIAARISRNRRIKKYIKRDRKNERKEKLKNQPKENSNNWRKTHGLPTTRRPEKRRRRR